MRSMVPAGELTEFAGRVLTLLVAQPAETVLYTAGRLGTLRVQLKLLPHDGGQALEIAFRRRNAELEAVRLVWPRHVRAEILRGVSIYNAAESSAQIVSNNTRIFPIVICLSALCNAEQATEYVQHHLGIVAAPKQLV
jgi:hypothetical protein